MSGELAEHGAQVVEAHGKIGEEGVGPARGEPAEEVDGLLCGLERVLAAAEIAEHVAQVGEARGEIGEEGVGPGRTECQPIRAARGVRLFVFASLIAFNALVS
jgi:hypothetical protein